MEIGHGYTYVVGDTHFIVSRYTDVVMVPMFQQMSNEFNTMEICTN